MKKFLLLTCLFFAFTLCMAQHVPQGMKYQAVARSLSGEILANQEISLKISLYSPGSTNTVHYSEVHKAVTNSLGLFSLVIGEGSSDKGKFSDVPWSTEDIWMEVAIKDKGNANFSVISSSKLLAVPYAFHAATASALSPGQAVKIAGKETSDNDKSDPCNTNGGLVLIRVLYNGPDFAQIKVYSDRDSRISKTFTGVKDGDILLIDARQLSPGSKKLDQQTYLQIIGGTNPVTAIPTGGQGQIVTQIFNNFSVLSVLAFKDADAKNPNTTECSVCNIPQDWMIGGNVASDLCNRLGSKNKSDVVIITSNTERMRINSAGDVNVSNNLTTGKNLTVVGTTLLDSSLTVLGLTSITNNTQSTTPYNGAEIVTGGVGIGGNLNVAGATNFGSVNVSTNISAKSLNITDNNPSYIAYFTNTNTEEGDGIKIKLGRVHPLWNGTSYESITVDDFNPVYHAFQPQINTVSGWIKNRSVTVTPDDLLSLLKSTGTFIAGALCQLTNALSPMLNQKIGLPMDISTPINNGIGLPIDVSTPLNNGLGLPLDITGPINNGLGLPIYLGPYSVPDVKMPAVTMPAVVLPALSVDLGKVLGSFDIIGKTTLFPATTLFSATTLLPGFTLIPKFQLMPSLPAFSIPKIPAFSIPKIPAFSIPAIPQIDCSGLPQIGAPTILTSDLANSLTNKNEYIKFADKDDRTVGVIRAESIGDFSKNHLSNDYLFHLVSTVGGIDIAQGLLHLASEFNTVAHLYNKLGVEYVSGNGDYAEWMERENKEEPITAGDIVGVKGGRITKELKGAEQIMAVSTQPIVSANMPNKEKVGFGNTIAFMGQIPVKIVGSVTTGDFIVAKGDIPGYGVAVKSSDMTAEDFRLVVGRAWETIHVDGPKLVNTLVGVQNNDFLKIIQKYQQKVISAEERLDAIEKKLNMNATAVKKKSSIKK